MSSISNSEPSTHLTFQEIKVIALIKQGHSNQEIAEQLHIAVSTVKTHRKNILKKIGLKGKTAFMQFVFSFTPPLFSMKKTRNYTFDTIYPTKILLISYLGRIVAQSYN